jgi:hypothetical protein
MAVSRSEILDLVKTNPEGATDLLMQYVTKESVPKVTSQNTVDEIINGLIGGIHTGLLEELHNVPDLSDKLTKNLDELVAKLKTS